MTARLHGGVAPPGAGAQLRVCAGTGACSGLAKLGCFRAQFAKLGHVCLRACAHTCPHMITPRRGRPAMWTHA